MIVRIVIYETEFRQAARDRVRKRAEDVHALPGVERFDVVSQQDPPRAGAIFYFTSRDHFEAHREERLLNLMGTLILSIPPREGGRG